MKRYESESWLRMQYLTNKRTAKDIAAECKVTEQTVHNWLKKFGIATNKAGLRRGRR